MTKKNTLIVTLVFILSLFVVVLGRHPYSTYAKIVGIKVSDKAPKQLYRVYLAGNSLGIINSKKELEDLIDTKQNELKKKYNVDKIYAPNDLKIMRETTYSNNILSVDEIYNKIESIRGTSSFTIDGYKIEIKGIEKKDENGIIEAKDIILYVLDKDIFEKSVVKTVTAFIDNDRYEAYINGKQKPLEENETGSIIDSLHIENDINITKCRIPAEDNIYTSEEDLSKFLLFGTTAEQEVYTVKSGDTIEEIAYNNRLSIEEFLIANTTFKSAADLLFPGQQVKLGLIAPQFDLVETETTVEKQVHNKNIVYKDDNTQYVGYEKVEEEGKDGLDLVTTKKELVNGEIIESIPISTIELVPPIDKVVIRGTKRYQSSLGSEITVPVGIGSWVWPTNAPYSVSSTFGWRWGKLHEGIDITGTGYGSPIKAANNGIVVQSSYNSVSGNFIIIKHSNNYYTYYAHMVVRKKQVGDIVMAGDQIGTMGMSGFATGVHLHFGLYNGYPYRGGVPTNPHILYR